MASIALGQSSNCATPRLDVFIKISGVPVDPSELSYQIFEKVSNPGVPVQVYPPTTGQRAQVDMNDCPNGQRLDVGHFFASFTAPTTAIIGTHEIRWFYKVAPVPTEQQFAEEFEVIGIDSSTGYITVAEIRALGLTADPPTNAQIQAAIVMWQSVIERICRQWFRPIPLELRFDGTDSDAIHFGVPIISIDEVRINGGTEALDPAFYEYYAATIYPDDHANPRLKLKNSTEEYYDIYRAPLDYGRLKFRKGRKNQYVRGVFGYVDANGQTPPAIKHALTKLVYEKLAKPAIPGSTGDMLVPPIMQGIVIEEWTDGHRIRNAPAYGALRPRNPELSGITQDQEILDILRLYRAPLGIATPAGPSYR